MSFYQTLLSVEVEHAYYPNKLCPGLDFEPTAATRRIFDNTGLLCKPSRKGIWIVYDRQNPQALELYAREAMSFDFRVYSSDPGFRAFTEPFGADFDGLLYTDNSARAPAVDSAAEILTATQYLRFEDIEAAEKRARRERELKRGRQAGDLDQRGLDELSLLEARPEEEQSQDRFLCECGEMLGRKRYSPAPVFLLRISVRDKQGSLLQSWREQQTAYRIEFESRKRYWKYYLLGSLVNEDNPSRDLYVDEAEKRFKFKTLGEERLSDRSLAYTFRSEQPIPLKQSYLLDEAGARDAYLYEFRLMRKGQDETPLIDRLPYASVGKAVMEKVSQQAAEEQAEIVSEIYINS